VKPKDIQLIGSELAIVWDDGKESYFPSDFLLKYSPSAQNIVEIDIFGNQYGGDGPKKFEGVTIKGWELQGNYAIRPIFSDGHSSGLFSWEFLKELESRLS
jgi:DUF971 family protein